MDRSNGIGECVCCTITLAFYFAREYYTLIKELPTGKGFADICFLPRGLYMDKPAMIIELKWDKNVQGAIAQIEDKKYTDALKDYHGNILLVGINYNKKTKEHTCIIKKKCFDFFSPHTFKESGICKK
ncbi:PD-(D/E)XK nuclease domain-containing protein [Anaerobutyricum hallii]